MNKLGLTTIEAEKLLEEFGPNELPSKQGFSALELFISQFKNILVYILAGAIILSFTVGDALDGGLILAILLLNIGLGFWQEYKATKELEALRKLEVLNARILRDGKEIKILATQIVPGDIVILEPGDKIPADGKVLQGLSLMVNESSLTGESLPVVKAISHELFFGTTVISGRGKFKVCQTGSKTKFGRIALSLTTLEEEKSPLELLLTGLGKKIGLLAIGLGVLTLVIRVIQGYTFSEVLFGSIALMVAAVPEGLLAVVTVVLALGVSGMYRKKTLVRKMVAVESLGAATVVCCDKTGTLTKNQMEVTEVLSSKKAELLKCAVLCNSSSLVLKEDGGSYDILGDTTEGALLVWAKKEGLDIDLLRDEGKLIDEKPFNLTDRMMTTVWQHGNKRETYSKGAPERIIIKSDLSDAQKEIWMKKSENLAALGLRVMAFAKGEEFLGIVGISDPPRPQAREAVKEAKDAGIRVVMITGDNELTAKKIAEEVGLLEEGDEVVTGLQLDELTDEELKGRLTKIRVFARSTPEQKLRIIKLYQSMGEVVAVTGDGVNDVLALKQAQVGVAMGITGTDVAKEASDIVILDDNFASLISAIEQGRLVYSNIVKVVRFLLAGNFSEVLIIVGAVFLGLPNPLLPAQILWINFVTDGLPALALGLDSPSSNLMKVPPRGNTGFLEKRFLLSILLIGGVIGAVILAVFALVLRTDLQIARSVTFNLVVISQMILVIVIRRHHSVFSNKYLLLSIVSVLLMQLLIMLYPPLKQLFKL